jgi:hypothetical protein
MKNIHQLRLIPLFITLLLFAASCHPVLQLGKKPAAVAPYVRLKDGTVIHAKEAGQEMDFQNSRIVADDQAFPRKQVAIYSNGEQTFANLHNGKFGPKIAEGKINVYSVTNAAHYGYPYHDYGELYIQDSGSSNLRYMRYRTLKPMIPAYSPAGQVLAGYKQTRTVVRLTLLGGFAAFFAGTAIAGNGVMQNNGDGKIRTGMAMIVGGAGIITTATISLYANKTKMRRAVAIRNGVLSYR